MTTELEVKEINDTLPEHGRIFWDGGNGWNSFLWLDLSKQGWTSRLTPAGFVDVYDAKKTHVLVAFGRVDMLAKVARLMR